MSDFELVDIPPEEPEQTLEPWEVYMTDPTVKAAVFRYMSDEELLSGDMPVAAAYVAKTVAPAPHNIAAHDARYLLAPEAVAADEEVWHGQLHPWSGQPVESFDRQAQLQAADDGPDTAEGLAYSAGLQNRGGVEIDAPGQLQQPASAADVEAMDAANARDFYDHRTQTRRPLPPSRDEAGYTAFSRRWATGGDENGPWFDNGRHRQEIAQMIQQMADLMHSAGHVPLGPPVVTWERNGRLVSADPDHPVLWMVDFRMEGVLAHGRAFLLGMDIGDPETLESGAQEIEERQQGCRRWQWNHYGALTVGVGWDLHPHSRRLVLTGLPGGYSWEQLAEALFGVSIDELRRSD